MNKYSFKEILEKEISYGDGDTTVKIDRIEIPKIQRDYAQGRKEGYAIRDRFLEVIFSTLDIASDARARESELCMDFVYGSTAGGVFVPLDGQQRLTTLFLLYWYIGSRELQGMEKDMLMYLLSRFTYETRISSRQFCKNLVTGDMTCLTFKDVPGKEIRDSSWFYRSYDQDPTIKSMLTMLDSIHAKYGKTSNKPLYQRLEKLKFYILPLDGFGLSDELYVNMNARGKPLTDAENFKADLTNWMKSDDNPYKNEYHRKVMLDGREMDYYLAFAQKMDANWTSFFWNI
ncbi:MAG: DUF262 domain-containing protein, partial [Planctomycetaceae bacterium]|nr:DUF262 domain-containing protein [Planctomycetaceae bacterium]